LLDFGYDALEGIEPRRVGIGHLPCGAGWIVESSFHSDAEIIRIEPHLHFIAW